MEIEEQFITHIIKRVLRDQQHELIDRNISKHLSQEYEHPTQAAEMMEHI